MWSVELEINSPFYER